MPAAWAVVAVLDDMTVTGGIRRYEGQLRKVRSLVHRASQLPQVAGKTGL